MFWKDDIFILLFADIISEWWIGVRCWIVSPFSSQLSEGLIRPELFLTAYLTNCLQSFTAPAGGGVKDSPTEAAVVKYRGNGAHFFSQSLESYRSCQKFWCCSEVWKSSWVHQTNTDEDSDCLLVFLTWFSSLFLTWPPSPLFLFSRPSHCLHSLFPLLSLPRCLAGFYCSSDNQRLSLLCHSVWVLQIAYLMEAYTPGAPTPTPLYSCRPYVLTQPTHTHASRREKQFVAAV